MTREWGDNYEAQRITERWIPDNATHFRHDEPPDITLESYSSLSKQT